MRPLFGTSVVIGTIALLGSACAGESEPQTAPTSAAPSTSSASPAAGVPAGFTVDEVDTFEEPWAMTFLPGGSDLLVTNRSGSMFLRDGETGEKTEVGGVPEVYHAGQLGLGDVVLSPTFEDDQTVYLSWSEEGDGGAGGVVGRAQLETGDGEASLEGLEKIWIQNPKVSGNGHVSHRLAFSPDGEQLYVTSGERQQKSPAQDLSNDLGKVIRMNPDGSDAAIYTYGHRNLLGIDFAADGTLWSSEMGPEGGDELNRIVEGDNYGWPLASNGSDYDGTDIPDHAEGDGFTAPFAFWTPSISPSSLVVYDGEMFPGLQNHALIGALSGKALVQVDLESGETSEWKLDDQRIREVEQGPDGAIWVLEDEGSGRLLRLTPEAA